MNWPALVASGFGLLMVIAAGTGAQGHMRAMLAPGAEGRIVAQRRRSIVDEGTTSHFVEVTVSTDRGETRRVDRTFFLASEADAWLAARPEGGRLRLQIDPRAGGDEWEADQDDSSTAVAVIGFVTMLVGLWWATHG